MARQLRIDEVTATPAVVEKLWAKHALSIDEVSDVVFDRRTHTRRGAAGFYLLYGRSRAGRYVFAVIGLVKRRARVSPREIWRPLKEGSMASRRAAKRTPKLPRFRGDEEAARYFETHDTADLAVALPVAGPIVDARKPLKPISLRLPVEAISAAKQVAREKGVGYQVLLRIWITERLAMERRRAS